jgi:hypothetical protein
MRGQAASGKPVALAIALSGIASNPQSSNIWASTVFYGLENAARKSYAQGSDNYCRTKVPRRKSQPKTPGDGER